MRETTESDAQNRLEDRRASSIHVVGNYNGSCISPSPATGGPGGWKVYCSDTRKLHCYELAQWLDQPSVYIPAHHDADLNGTWRPAEPIFQALKDKDASLITLSKQYREPVCLDTKNSVQRHGSQ